MTFLSAFIEAALSHLKMIFHLPSVQRLDVFNDLVGNSLIH